MAKNQLIIGLGGVGGQSIAAFRRAIVLHKKDYEKLVEDGCQFEYLYIDSNDDCLNASYWEIYGQDVKLDAADVVMLKQASGNSASPMRSISESANIKPWIGDFRRTFAKRTGKKSIDESLDREIFGLKGASQLRRYGRVLFAMNAAKIREILRSKLDNLTVNSESKVDVRIFCTLGGGTGSGSIVDMVVLVQELAQAGHEYETTIYPFIAGEIHDDQDAGSFYQNEYAALRDLNALMVKKLNPFSVARKIPGFFESDNAPIHSIYISSEESPGTPSLSDQIDFTVKACLDMIVYGQNNYKNTKSLKAITHEDLMPSAPGEPSPKNLLRSYGFAALGAKRLCVPTEQIKQLLQKEYAQRVLKSWLIGTNLPSNIKQRDVNKVEIHFDPLAGKTKEKIDKWVEVVKKRLIDEYESIRRQEKRDEDTLKIMHEKADQVSQEAIKLLSDSEWRSDIAVSSEQDAAAIIRLVQTEMDKRMKWTIGGGEAWGLEDVRRFITIVNQRISSWKSKFVGNYTSEDVHRLRSELTDNMKKREGQWEKLGFLTVHLTQKDERMIENHFADCSSYVDIALLHFKNEAIDCLIDEVRKNMNAYNDRVEAVIEEVANQCTICETTIGKIETDLFANSKTSNISDQYEFDIDNLNKVRDKIATLTKEHHNNMAKVFSQAWERNIGSLATFTSNQTNKLMDDIKSQLYTCSTDLHNKATDGAGASLQGVLWGSIFDRLKQIAGNTPGKDKENWERALDKIIKNFVTKFRSSSYIVSEQPLTDPQTSPREALVFGFPRNAKSSPEFVDWLQSKIRRSISNEYKTSDQLVDFYEHETAGEIRMLYLPYWLPARFAPVVKSIYRRYAESAKNPEEAVKIYFANIDDDDIGLRSEKRPALTLEGEPDEKTAWLVDLAAKLKIVSGEREFPVLSETEKGIKLLQSLEDGMAEYTKAYSVEERYYPSRMFKNDLESGMSLAKGMMDDLQKQAVLRQYREEYDKFAEGSDEADKAKENYKNVRDELGL